MAPINIIINAINNASSKIKQVDKDTGGLVTAVGSLAAGALATKQILQTAFDFGQEGAQLLQLEQSFAGVTEQVGLGPGILNEWRSAARGTIPDTELMAGALTLVAGTGPELQRSLLENTGALLEIAKAANKLNPSLGDTAFLYESITRGIKRNSPLILDNLGIVVKIGDANERFAAQLGKTVDELTAEEKQMALLNEVLRSGDNLINQVGGNVASATDEFERMTAELVNFQENIKKETAPVLTRLVSGLNEWFVVLRGTLPILQEHEQNVRDTAGSYDEYRAEILRAAGAAGFLVRETEEGIRIFKQTRGGIQDVTEEIGFQTREIFDNTRERERWAGVTNMTWEEEARLKNQIFETTEAIEDQEEATRLAKEEQERFRAELSELGALMDDTLSRSFEDFQETIGDLEDERGELEDGIAELESRTWLSTRQKEELEELRAQLGDVNAKIEEEGRLIEEATAKFLFGLLQQRAAADGLTSEELELLTGVAEQFGLIDETQAEVIAAVDQGLQDLAEGKGVQDVQAELEEILERLEQMAQGVDIPITVNDQTGGATGGGGGTGTGTTGGGAQPPPNIPILTQSGFSGVTRKPTLFMTSEFGQPETVNIRPGIQATGGGGGRGGDVFNIRINDRSAAALFMALLDERQRVRLNDFMGD